MRIKGFATKTEEKVPYFVSIPAIDGVTQGKSLRNAHAMARDYVGLMLEEVTGGQVNAESVRIVPGNDGEFWIETSEVKALLSLILQRQRARAELSQAELAERLGQASKTGVAQYERAKIDPSIGKFAELLAGLGLELAIDVVESKGKAGAKATA